MEPDSSQQKESKNSGAIVDRSDEWLLREWKSGDERAAAVLFDRYSVRLVALVASRLNHRYQSAIDPNGIVQSAMGSFFDAAKHSRIQVSSSVSLWRLLATFARRKMARSIERHSAAKRGGDLTRLSLNDLPPLANDRTDISEKYVDDFLATLKTELADDLFAVVEGLLAGHTQREIADSLKIDERTVRRRLLRVRELLAPEVRDERKTVLPETSPTLLPRVSYREFVLGKLIGSGGFGKVYRASMQSDGSRVAVKFLRKSFWQNEVARQTFMREINIASQITHPNVIRYLGYGESPQGGPYVISEYINGQSLQSISSFSSRQLEGWLKQICESVEAVHQAGLVHGDLTPSNVLVDPQDRITITDFGFSQATAESASSILGGTLGFAAPEQIDRAFGLVGVKTDVYAIGGLIHWLLFHHPPNVGQSLEGTLSQTLSHQEVKASALESVPQAYREIMLATLRKSPADRDMSLADILRALPSTTTLD